MSRIRVTKEFDFEMAHALWNYDGDCRNIHGHSYKLFVTVIGEPVYDPDNPKFGMVMDFRDLKEIVRKPVVDFLDHSLVVYSASDGAVITEVKKLYKKVHVFDFQPTCENLVLFIAGKLRGLLTPGVELKSVKLYETATSYAEWVADDDN